MPIACIRSTLGGKGNIGKFVDRQPTVCAAGITSAQPNDCVADNLKQYLPQDEADALISDAIIPPLKPRTLPPLRHPIRRDMRNAYIGEAAHLLNPPLKSKTEILANEIKDTIYTSYWNKQLGRGRDSTPMLPEGFDTVGTTMGKKTPFHGRLYDIVMPKKPLPDKTPLHKGVAAHINRNYCGSFDPNLTYGYRSRLDNQGKRIKCSLTDDRRVLGTAEYIILGIKQAKFQEENLIELGKSVTPNNNIREVPKGYTFGKLIPPGNIPECLTNCNINPENQYLKKCLGHLNSVRNILAKKFLPTFFYRFYLSLKFLDKKNIGWLPKEVVYNECGPRLIRFDGELIEHILSLCNAFDGSCIEYKTFIQIINCRENMPELPKIEDIPQKCLHFSTTYTEMVKPGQKIDTGFMAGIPSGRYFDRNYPMTPNWYSRAEKVNLPDESDMKSCLCPSVLSAMDVSHRDMYVRRDQHSVRRVFEESGEHFTDERFESVWQNAKKFHSQGWVCFETFRRALENIPRLFENNSQ